MRMRKLGVGQSVVFCVPEEIETKVRAMTANTKGRSMSVEDILEWAIRGTWDDLRRSMPLWLTQGKNFARHKVLWDLARAENGESLVCGDAGTAFLEDEAQNLETRYRPRDKARDRAPEQVADKVILDQIRQRCELYAGIEVTSSKLQEEQERELAPEIEQERQTERPAAATPAKHSVHADVREFIKTGEINPATRDKAFMWAFDVFKKTTASAYLDLDHFPRSLLATRDFETTVTRTKTDGVCIDNYLRGVQWVLSDGQKNKKVTTMVILSPYEANELIPEIETSKAVVLHLFHLGPTKR